jgi:LysR family transcriptional regulator (chromosome initiation inhibitor)
LLVEIAADFDCDWMESKDMAAMLNREQLETLASVVEAGSFEGAASALNVTRGAVSQRVKALEEHLSTKLLVREKPVALTLSGEVLMRHVKALRLMEGAVFTELMPQPAGRGLTPVAIAVNADSLATWFPDALWSLLLKGKLALELIVDDQDHTLERLVKGEVIGCISTASKAIPGFAADLLGHMAYRCYATPQFVKEHFSNGFNLQAALEAPAVTFNRKDTLHDEYLEKTFGFRVARYARHFLPDPEALLKAVLQSVGYGVLPMAHAAPAVLDGQLIDLVPSQAMRVPLYWHRWEAENSVFDEMTRLIGEHAKRGLEQVSLASPSGQRPPLPVQHAEDQGSGGCKETPSQSCQIGVPGS